MNRLEPKPVIAYALASAGMGHATRAVPILEWLSTRYEVHIFCGGPAYRWLAKKFPNVHWIRRFVSVSVGARSSLPLMLAWAALTLPVTIASILKVAGFVVARRPLVLITDFEGQAVYAALLLRPWLKTRIVECDDWSTLRFAEPPFALTEAERAALARWQRLVRSIVCFADAHLVQGVLRSSLSHPRARYVPPPIRDAFGKYAGALASDGPIVVSLGAARKLPSLPDVLAKTGLSFVVFGWHEESTEGAVSYRTFSEDEYVAALARAPFAVVSGNSSALDALALKKPFIMHPAPGQFEQRYRARSYEALGVAKFVEDLTVESLVDFARDCERYRERAAEVSVFDNGAVFAELEREIEAASAALRDRALARSR
jgi:hypothetical protein